MTSTKTFPLNSDVKMVIELSPAAAPRNGFNLGLIIGKSTHITAAQRISLFNSLDEMIAAGFANTDPEYLAATLYFSAPSRPTQLYIGCQLTGETPAQAVEACRIANNEWYTCFICDATQAEIEAVAAYIESATPASVQFFATSDTAVLAGTQDATNIFYSLHNKEYQRSIGQYSTTPYAVASIMGEAMGANTGLIDSAYTLKFKKEPGVTPENQSTTGLTTTQLNNILNNFGNVYINKGSYYNMFEPGVMADATHFDEVIGLDQLVNNIQLNVMDLFYQTKKIPYTDAGVHRIVTATSSACNKAVETGFLAPGIWNAASILTLSEGAMLDKGYVILAESVSTQSAANKSKRIAPPIYVCTNLAGAIESTVIQINVNL